MPRRSRAETVTERPSTSGGPTSTNHFGNPDFNNRVSRDDLALALKSSGRGNVKAYHVPIRGRLPSPETSPRGKSQSPHRVTMVRTATPESMVDAGETGLIAIGMALGSPNQPAAVENTPPTWRTRRAMTTAAADFPEPVEDLQAGQQKPKKWNLFRSRSKRSRPAEPQRSMTDNSNASSISLTAKGQPSTSSKNAAQQDASKKTAKHKPIVIRSQTDPSVVEPVESREPVPELKPVKETKPAKETKSGGLGRKVSLRALRGDSRARKAAEKAEPVPSMPAMPTVLSPPSPPPPMPQLLGPLLNVEIPSIKMERYSVMFGGVLGTENSSSSLLARRQATLDRLKTINDEMTQNGEEELPRPRRATSPQPKASPVFSLFPGLPKASPSQPSPRGRSNTSPAMLHSPVVTKFDIEARSRKEHNLGETLKPKVFQPAVTTDSIGDKKSETEAAVDSPKLVSKFSKQPKRPVAPKPEQPSIPRPSRTPSPATLEVQAQARGRQPSPFTPDTSSLILDSPENSDAEDEETEEAEIHITDKLRPTLTEPKWQMVSPPASTTSSSPTMTRKRSPPSSVASPEEITVVKSPPPEVDPEEALRNAVEISIARQISVSHQQRKMLHPLKSNPSLRHPHDGKGSNYGIPVGKNERLAETKTATPRLVRPEDINAFQMHRKSSRVIVEGEPST
ncbi:hypothetical protein AK830_g6766 [Neonectria ditissima]|uniref:Uncharacterized protein n=1 Tax=Neonectria ditissima TaxID=78410 RepID=A0A0P7APR4_9HYPO|nr:hypothetical protein AK830_g6766 [Neonectria ditissima]